MVILLQFYLCEMSRNEIKNVDRLYNERCLSDLYKDIVSVI